MHTFEALAALILSLSFPLTAAAQSGDDAKIVPMEDARGPYGGLIYDIAYGPHDGDLAAFALTEVGVSRFDEASATWVSAGVLPPEAPGAPSVPMRIDWSHLAGARGLYRPTNTELFVDEHNFVLRDERGRHWRARRGGGSWTPWSPPTETLDGPSPFSRATRVSTALGRADTDQLLVLRTDTGKIGDHSRIWTRDALSGGWAQIPWPGRAVLMQVGRRKAAPSWRNEGSVVPLQDDGLGVLVGSFLRPRLSGDASLRFREIRWAEYLAGTSKSVQEGCRGVHGMLEVSIVGRTQATVIGVGDDALCVSDDGGASFAPRASFIDRDPRRRVGDLVAVTAFPWPAAEGGVRIFVATEGEFTLEAPRSRARGGKLWLSDDGGVSWVDATPDIDAPGTLIDLESRPLPGGGREVWLLTARRGSYRSTDGGSNFTRRVTGISAQPVGQLAADPLGKGALWLASPTGLHNFDNGWRRTLVAPIRSVATWPASDTDLGQVWAGSYHGEVLVRAQDGHFEREALGEVPQRWDTLRVEATRLERELVSADRLRRVSGVVPTGLRDGSDTGYALVDGEGIARREGKGWYWIERPSGAGSRIVAAVPATLRKGHVGLVILGTKMGAAGVVATASLHAPSGPWQDLPLPSGFMPAAATRLGDTIWMASVTGELRAIETASGQPTLGPAVSLTLPCVTLTTGTGGALACTMAGGTPGAGTPSTERPRALATVLNLNSDMLRGDSTPDGAMRYEVANPRGEEFRPPRDVVFVQNDVGEYPWITTGMGVYTTRRALLNLLPAEGDAPPLTIPWEWLTPTAGLALAIALGLLLLKARRRIRRS